MAERDAINRMTFERHLPKALPLLAFLASAVLCACASHPKVAAKKPAIRSIAIIPATDPPWFSFENVNAIVYVVPVTFFANKLDSRHKAKLFNDQMKAKPPPLDSTLTDAVATALRGYGFTVEILDDVKRPPDDPDNIDYDKVSTHSDAILHLKIDEVGLYSSHTSTDYLPRVNISAKLFVKGLDDDVYEQDLCYGVDARKGKEWAVVADPKFAYPSFEAVMTDIDAVRAAFLTGTREIGLKVSEQIHESPNYVHADVRAPSP
jgi:hypothetical protein